MHQRGLETWPEGSSYSGEYSDGLKHGIGIYKWSDGSLYEGSWLVN